MSVSSSDLEVRYAHLLQPIRDLAQNWHIDLAQELEDYLHELDSITVTIDPSPSSLSSPSSSPSPSSLNFAEAALLIQGSACVYSKKVEYLYSLLYATLDVVIAKHKKDAKKSSIDPLGQDADWDGEQDLPLLPLDDLPLSTNVDLDESHARSYADERRITLLHRLPPSLSQTTAASVGQERTGALFRVSDCTVHASGALLLEGRDNVLLDTSLRRISSDAPFGSPAAVVKAHRASLGIVEAHSAAAISVELNFNDDGVDDGGDDHNGFEDAVAAQDSIPSHHDSAPSAEPTSASKPAKAVRFASDGHLCDYRDVQRSSITVDPYAVLDPFDSSVPVKPFKRGKTERTYKGKGQVALASGGLFSDSAAYALVSSEIEKGNVRMPCHAEFASLFMRHMHHVKRQQRLKRKRDTDVSTLPRSSSPVADPIDDDADADLFDALPLDGGDDGWEQADLPSADDVPAPLALDGDTSEFSRTFEDLCREHLDAYLHSADEWLKSSEMTTKVREWQEKLEPILEEEDMHPTFDILEYGDRMLGNLEQQKHDGDVVEFENAVRGVERYDICRLFLATLQLANNGNVDILPSTLTSAGSGDVDDACTAFSSLSVKVLSTLQRGPNDIMDALKLSSGRTVHSAEVDSIEEIEKAAKRRDSEEEEEEVEDEEVEMRTRKRKVRQTTASGKGRALQPVDGNRSRRRLRQAA